MTKRLLACWVITMLLSMPVHAGWIRIQGGQLPQDAIIAGENRNGQPLYICRAYHGDGVYPGILAGTSRDCIISYDGKEYSTSNYEVLVGSDYSWVAVYNGEIPFDALPAGNIQRRKSLTLYICRGEVNSERRPGKISKTDSGCRVSYAGKERTALWYEVLVGN